MTKAFVAAVDAEQRALILKLLLEDVDRTHGERILLAGLKGLGHAMGRDAMHILLSWLETASLVEIEDVDGVWFATLTGRGAEVARGDVWIPGVTHPRDLV